MGEPGDRDAARVRFPPPLLPLAAVLIGVALQRWAPIDLGFDVAPVARYIVGGGLVVLAFLTLAIPASRAFHRTGQSDIPWTPTPEIVEGGPFRFTRNPMYLTMLLACVGFAILLFNPWILLLTPLVALGLYVAAIRPEEEYLEAKFGDAYLAYKGRVRRWL
ncbi:isoprenylcysteine carboxyl methyltransferase [Knoellia sinensis KCTC 19936]|uniref:Isoprenylcysteine carboxyl methyltransferase n=1 Tax=Knoellia sinensis KCTC 19936 TaxID=1385520 RepID=A0A0A0J6K4_9MICO|nr:isoprenylcysteine carboxylmethyltransferase family protein [Knoellia sinensis]KGN31697.1 isoprenylcysteine carboxyl methyltransferase [Knoellia sinensis KCTC 19936]